MYMYVCIYVVISICLPCDIYIISLIIDRLEPSHGCGPFRIYEHTSDIWDVTVDTFPSVINSIFDVLSSTTFFVCALLLAV